MKAFTQPAMQAMNEQLVTLLVDTEDGLLQAC